MKPEEREQLERLVEVLTVDQLKTAAIQLIRETDDLGKLVATCTKCALVFSIKIKQTRGKEKKKE